MWTNETIFSAGDLAQREKWIEFMRNEFGANGKLDEESVVCRTSLKSQISLKMSYAQSCSMMKSERKYLENHRGLKNS